MNLGFGMGRPSDLVRCSKGNLTMMGIKTRTVRMFRCPIIVLLNRYMSPIPPNAFLSLDVLVELEMKALACQICWNPCIGFPHPAASGA
ncbi:hypothetical protein QJS10_CPB19g00199 [Acorus calamus]|uniref:Uncharacterized protein n=1 Tax=Acorus calamus TaxID=4465 RepID=A0AAV9CDP8_ACOCL|nr:hypothetical protein QJS10_CPB19g00199 [Acorus calamus]